MKVQECVVANEVIRGTPDELVLWEAIVVPAEVKERLRNQSLLSMLLPSPEAVQQILQATLLALSETYPGLRDLATSPALEVVAARAAGLDGRRVRKIVFEALARRLETVLDPGMLTEHDLAAAAAVAVADELGLGDQEEHAHAAA